jgi:RNA polymerase sigma factor (sigma-70 family)
MNSGDPFETIVSEHYEPLFRFAMSLTRVESDAQDLTQQTFYVWATKGHQLRDASKVKTWLFTTLHRAFLKSRQRQLRFPHDDLEEVEDQLPVLSEHLSDRVDSADVLPALAKVDEIYQAAVALFYLEDCSYKEIAAILDVPLGTVKSRIARGIEQLREIFLANDSQDFRAAKTKTSNEANTQQPAPPPAGVPPHSPSQERSIDEIIRCVYEEWDLSSTHLEEPPGAS